MIPDFITGGKGDFLSLEIFQQNLTIMLRFQKEL
jgi:hypothetical protein